MIDTHCHIDLYPNPEALLQRLDHQQATVIGVTNLPSHHRMGKPHVQHFRRIRLAVGLHPLMTEHHSVEEKKLFQETIKTCSYVGEVGLDGSSAGKSTLAVQRKSFEFVLQCIQHKQYFVTLHSRGAEQDVLSMLEEHGIHQTIFHWYTGPLKLVDSILAAGHYFSINPAMIRTQKGLALLSHLPQDRVLTESDGPHIMQGSQPVDPFDVQQVEKHLSDIWNADRLMVESVIKRNFLDLIKGLST